MLGLLVITEWLAFIYLCNLGVILQLLQLALIVCDEVFEHCVVAVHAVFSFGQLHASLQLPNIQQDVIQRHCQHGRVKRKDSLHLWKTIKGICVALCGSPAAAFST